MNQSLTIFLIFSFIFACSCELSITFNGTVLDVNQTVDVIEGDSFEFTCTTNQNVVVTLATSPNGSIANTFPGNGVQIRTFSRSYIPRSISSTVFTCADGSGSGRSFTLNVLYKPEYSTFPMSSYTAKEDEPFTVSTVVDSNPPVLDSDTVWTRDGMVITESSRVQLNSTTISITSVSREDSGEYVVEGTNTVGSGNASFDLEVFFGPDFANIGGNIQLTVNQSLQINCSVTDSNPSVESVNISGYGISGMMTLPSDNRVYEVEMVTLAYNGETFTCTASNGETMRQIMYTVTVNEAPTSTSTTTMTATPSSSTMSISPSPSPTTDPTNVQSEKSSISGGAIAGIVVGIVVFVIVIIAVIVVAVFLKMRSKTKTPTVKPDQTPSDDGDDL